MLIDVNKWFGLGITSGMDAEQRRKIFLTNTLAVSIAFLATVISINDYLIAGNYLAGHRRVVVVFFLASVPVFNYLRLHTIAKIILTFIPGFVLFIVPIIFSDFFPGQLLWFHYGTAIMSAFPILLFHHKKERFLSASFFMTYFLLTIYIDELLIYANPIEYSFSPFMENFTDYKVPPIFLSLVFSTVVFWFNIINVKYSSKLKLVNKSLSQTNAQLLIKTEQLDVLNSNLEGLVKERAAIIAAKNKQIIEYANLNAHKVRGPLARILGLINLTEHTNDQSELKDLIEKMGYSADELNEIITEMNSLLSEAD